MQNPFSFLRSESDFNLDSEKFENNFNNDKGAVLIDVRTPEEFNTGHIPGAMNIDISSYEFKNRISQMDKSGSYYLYCRSGSRSYTAGKMMKNMGFEKVYNLEGGIIDWHRPLER